MTATLPALTEAQFQAQITEYAELCGWLVYHTYDSRRSNPGFPDLILIRGNRLYALEVKTEKGKPTDEQWQWIAALAGVTVIGAGLVRPSDWDFIERELR